MSWEDKYDAMCEARGDAEAEAKAEVLDEIIKDFDEWANTEYDSIESIHYIMNLREKYKTWRNEL